MARIDTELNQNQVNKELLKREVKQEIKKEFFRSELKGKFRKFFRKIGCLLIVLFILFSLGVVGAAAVAKTGLYNIPIISKIFYEQPEPLRTVQIDKPVSQIMADLGWQVAGELASSQSSVITISLAESELTALARESFASSSLLRSRINIDTLQLAATSEEIEFFSQLYWPKQTHLTVGFNLVVEAETIKLEMTRWHLGGLKMPLSLGNWLLNKFLSSRVDQMLSSVLQKIQVQEIKTAEGKIIFKGVLK